MRIALLLFAGLLVAATFADAGDGGSVGCAGKRATIVGTSGDDRLTGTRRGDVIQGLGGDDRISGGRGSDRICGGAGDDVLRGGRSGRRANRLYGGRDGDFLDGRYGRSLCEGGPGVDIFRRCLNRR